MPNEVNVQLSTPTTMPKSVGYSQLATVHGGRIVFIAGQVALDKDGNFVGADDFSAQARQVFENLRAAVESAGGSFRDVIKLNTYLLDIAQLVHFRGIRDDYVNTDSPPVSTVIQVPRLFRPEFLLEVEAIAIIMNR